MQTESFMFWLLVLAGVVAGGYTIRAAIRFVSSKKTSVNIASQKGNVAGGDVVGRDKNTK